MDPTWLAQLFHVRLKRCKMESWSTQQLQYEYVHSIDHFIGNSLKILQACFP